MYGSADQNNNNNNQQSDYNYQNYDYENQDSYAYNKEQETTGLLGKSRLGFIRKVYLLLVSMLSITVIMTIISYNSESFQRFQYDNLWLYIFAWVAAIFIQIAVFCYQKVATTTPTNYILCFSFATCFSYMVSAICGMFFYDSQHTGGEVTGGTQVVIIAAGMTFGVTAALTAYAMTTKTDFTMMGGFLFMGIMTMMMFGMFWWVFGDNQVFNTIYCSIGVILYGFYLIYDTQLICGGKRFELDFDYYVLGAMMLFIDIIGMFLYLLQLLSRN